MKESRRCPSTALQQFIRCEYRDEYSMKGPAPSLYATQVYFSLTLKIILLQRLQSGISIAPFAIPYFTYVLHWR